MKLYVPNPQVWVDYYENLSKGSSKQSGSGRKPRIITVKPSSRKEASDISIKAVLPTEQLAAQAKSELERESINPKKVEKVFQKLSGRQGESIKRKTQAKSTHRSKRQKKEKHTRKRKAPAKKQHRDIFAIQ